jgi:16S rRNA (guanine966-N2)-methyltransferase
MRISGGKARGIPLRVTKSSLLRPATEANRERLFSSLHHKIQESKVLDLFAGSGSYGLEALSRGAKSVHFVENNRKIYKDLKYNFEQVQKSANLSTSAASFSSWDAIDFLKKKQDSYDFIFLDPPYPDFPKIGEKIFDFIHTNGFVHENSWLIHEGPIEAKSDFKQWEKIKVLGKEKKGSPSFRIFSPHFST